MFFSKKEYRELMLPFRFYDDERFRDLDLIGWGLNDKSYEELNEEYIQSQL